MRSESSDHHQKQISKQLKKTNYYEILDIKQNASQAEIKKSFKQMALKYHPDKNSATYSKQVFHKVSEAYDTLSDPEKRNAYDRKQQYQKFSRQSNPFKEPTVFFHKSGSTFYSDFDHEFRWNSFDYARRRAQEERMDERARHEREKFRKEQNQKSKYESKESGYPFFKRQGPSSKRAQEQKEKEKNQQKNQQKKQRQIPRERNYFGFTKPKMPNANQAEYEERRRQKQRKERLERQRYKANKNLTIFMLFMAMVVFWLYLDYNKVSFRGPPVYSMIQSSTHNISRFTQKLQSPFYVTKDYDERANADDRFRQHIERKMDFAYIKLLSRVCNNVKNRQEELQETMSMMKSAKSKKQLKEQLELLDMESCTKLHSLREMNPVYFQGLFSANSPREQL